MDEYISRKAAINATYALHFKDSIQEALHNLPAADVRPVKRGHWVKRMEEHTAVEYTSFTPIWSCSECALEYDPALAQRIHFCYNCGADMREAHDGI